MVSFHIQYILILSIAFLTAVSVAKKVVIPIQKYCSASFVLTDFGPSKPPECLEVVQGKKWTPILYDSVTFQRLDTNDSQLVEIKYLNSTWDCEENDLTLLWSKSLTQGDKRPLFILLTNGKLMWRSNKCTGGRCEHWTPFPTSQFYIDGLGTRVNINGSQVANFSGEESDQVIYTCISYIKEGEKLAHETLVENTPIYVGVLIVTCFFYLLTSTVYALLWKTQTLPGRTLLSVVLSRTLMSFFLSLAYFGQLHRWDIIAPHWWCVFVGVAAYFFLISAYSWVALLNFDFWWTFRTLRASSNTNDMRKKYIQYSCFGWGVPFLIAVFSLVIDAVYKSDLDANPLLVPNYGNGICFMVVSAQSMYVYLVQSLFLLPSLIFAILTFYAIREARSRGSTKIRKHGKKDTSTFQLYMKLFVLLSASWVIHLVSWLLQDNSPASAGGQRSATTKVVLLIQCFDAIGTAVVIFLIYVCKRSVLTKLEQNYKGFHALTDVIREARRKVKYPSSSAGTATTKHTQSQQ